MHGHLGVEQASCVIIDLALAAEVAIHHDPVIQLACRACKLGGEGGEQLVEAVVEPDPPRVGDGRGSLGGRVVVGLIAVEHEEVALMVELHVGYRGLRG